MTATLIVIDFNFSSEQERIKLMLLKSFFSKDNYNVFTDYQNENIHFAITINKLFVASVTLRLQNNQVVLSHNMYKRTALSVQAVDDIYKYYT